MSLYVFGESKGNRLPRMDEPSSKNRAGTRPGTIAIKR